MKPFAFLRRWREPFEHPAVPAALPAPAPEAAPDRDPSERWICYDDLAKALGVSFQSAHYRAMLFKLDRRKSARRRRKHGSRRYWELRVTDDLLAQMRAIKVRGTDRPAPVEQRASTPVFAAHPAPAKSGHGGRRPGAGRPRKVNVAPTPLTDLFGDQAPSSGPAAGAPTLTYAEAVKLGKSWKNKSNWALRNAHEAINTLPLEQRAAARRESGLC